MNNYIDDFKQELLRQSQALKLAHDKVTDNVVKALDILINCQGKVVVTGMGKAGLIGRKISATLASTGTTSIFLHPAEGIHGDLGMLQKNDVVIAISNSGNTEEVISIIPYIKFNNIPLIALTGNMESRLAKYSDIALDCSVPKDYEQLGLIPTASTTVELAMGDALAVALLKKRNFALEDYARFHPGGSIGKKLLLKVADLMHDQADVPFTSANATMDVAIMEMTSKKLGCTLITENKRLIGIVTDGDLRRFLQEGNSDIKNFPVEKAMTKNPKYIYADKLAVEALNLMEQYNITVLPVLDLDNIPVGVIHLHDLIKAGVV
ncbi:KpsF/GutQ family sugar-phosphate isomerase [bacterium]|nr:KpsF/GutQ family sugar-phosphate isomerase [bacterium]